MKKKNENFEWYVLNYDHNSNKVINYNIFNNWLLHEETIKLCKKFKSKKMTFSDFRDELRGLIMWQEWSRYEYEIFVVEWHGNAEKHLEKVDCYRQALPNIDNIARYVLYSYYPRLDMREIE